jgi:predicted GIY-YIG superfamily endonuclease
MELTNVYVLELQGGNYYVGSTKNIEERYRQHLNGSGAEWTKKHRPIKIIELLIDIGRFTEDMKVKEYMERHGMDKVRGGSYSTIKLEPEHIEAIEREIKSTQGLCYKCSKPGHFGDKCRVKIAKVNNIKETETDKTPLKKKKTSDPENITCSRCGRSNHKVDKCYASTHNDGHKLDEKSNVDIPTVISLKGKIHELGSKLENAPDNYLYIGNRLVMGGWNLQRSIWNNSFKTKDHGDETLQLYRDDILNNSELLKLLPTLKGKVLACWCHPDPCHGDVLVSLYKEFVEH